MNKLKVLYICEAVGGGVRRHLLDLLLNINKEKFDIHLVYNDKRGDEVFNSKINLLKNIGINLYKISEMERSISIRKDIISLFKLLKIVRKVKPDIVHCHSSKAGALGRIAAYICKVEKIYYTPHAYITQSLEISRVKRLIFNLIEKFLGLITTKTINVSLGEQKFAIQNKIIPLSKSLVIYNGIKGLSSNISRKKKEDIIIGTVARLDEQKDPLTFYKIAKSVVESFDNVQFVYVGDGNLKKQISKLIYDGRLEDKIHLLGFQSNIFDYFKNIDIYLSTSLYEGLPYSLIEAMSFGLPIVATDVIGNNELVIDGYNGRLFQKRDVDTAVRILEDLIKNAELRNNYGENSFRLYLKNFSLKFMIEKTENLYLE
jgi:glycosyltransferase involved in cell wall biosynthesis